MLYIVIPAYNEAKSMSGLLKNLASFLVGNEYLIIIINDGSSDLTTSIIENNKYTSNYKILTHLKNLGLGNAIKTGFDYLYNVIQERDIAITMDADNTHPPEVIGKMIEEINSGKDLVIASRYAIGGKEVGLNTFRKILSMGASTLLKIFFPIKNVTDYTSGYRAYSGAIILKSKEVFGKNLVTEKGFTCMAEILIKLSKITDRISETGLILRYDLKKGKSKIKIIKTVISYFFMVMRLKFAKT